MHCKVGHCNEEVRNSDSGESYYGYVPKMSPTQTKRQLCSYPYLLPESAIFLHIFISDNLHVWVVIVTFGQNSNPCTGSLILGSLVLGSSVLGLKILCPRIEDPQSWDYGSLVLGLRILSPRIEDP